MFFTKKLQEKGCLFPKNCKRKGTVSEMALEHPRKTIRQVPPGTTPILVPNTQNHA